jgi:hypothetical protein
MELRVTRARKIFSNGQHNAFTGIASFGGKVYVCFRTGTNHISPDGQITVIASSDMQRWEVVAQRADPNLDLRDPKLVVHRNRLCVYYYSATRQHEQQSWLFTSTDGQDFGPARLVEGGPAERTLWWLVPRDGVLYGTAYVEKNRTARTSLYASDDGVVWRELAEFPVRNGNEVSFDFDDEGKLWALVRSDWLGSVPTLCTLNPPYTTFEAVTQLPVRVQGPMLKRMKGGCLMIVRRWDLPLTHNRRTDIFWLPDGADLRYLRTLPSGGDTSYAGWLDIAPGKAVVSYYSSHEHKMDMPLGTPWEHDSGADIFLASMEWR